MSAEATIFQYRYVGYGTAFSSAPGARLEATADRSSLHGNEIAVDVGSQCLADDHATDPGALFVFDHHFRRDPPAENFPAAATAVLHHARAIHEHFANQPVVWLVAHEQPDFDAFCAMYLARCIIEDPAIAAACERHGIQQWPKSAWLNPHVAGIEEPLRSLILLAACAACVDQARHLNTPRTRALHSVLYAAIMRSRSLNSDGARGFFDEARAALAAKGLNPLFDSVLDERSTFAPELALLDREEEAYRRDIARARTCIVNLQTNAEDFGAWFARVAAQPFRSDGAVAPVHLQPSGPATVQADGLYLRDPESILFKEWARGDHDNSPSGRGFLFTAIAVSGEIPNPIAGNATRYWFSLDMERARAERCHLYNVWAALQAAELGTREKTGDPRLGESAGRKDFADRDSGADPWYDGNAFEATILDTPRRGSALAAGRQSDLSDDAVARIVRECLEYSWFQEHFADCEDIPSDPEVATSKHARHRIDLTRAIDHEPPPKCLRFCSITVLESVDLLQPQTAEQIGRLLWPVLERKDVATVPSDFISRHLVIDRDSVTVWNRRGLAIAFKGEAGAARSQQMEDTVREMAGIRVAVIAGLQLAVKRVEAAHPATANEDLLVRAEQLSRSLAAIQLNAAQPERTALRRFFEANRFGEILETVRGLHLQAAERARQARESAATARMDENLHTIAHVQTMVEWIEIFLVSVYAAELAHMIWSGSHLVPVIAAAAGAALTAWGVLPTKRQKIGVTAIAFVAFLGLAALIEPASEWFKHGAKAVAKIGQTDPHAVEKATATLTLAFQAGWFVLILAIIFILVRAMRSAKRGAHH